MRGKNSPSNPERGTSCSLASFACSSGAASKSIREAAEETKDANAKMACFKTTVSKNGVAFKIVIFASVALAKMLLCLARFTEEWLRWDSQLRSSQDVGEFIQPLDEVSSADLQAGLNIGNPDAVDL